MNLESIFNAILSIFLFHSSTLFAVKVSDKVLTEKRFRIFILVFITSSKSDDIENHSLSLSLVYDILFNFLRINWKVRFSRANGNV